MNSKTSPGLRRALFASITGLAAITLSPINLQAQTNIITNWNALTGQWNVAENWNPVGVPPAEDPLNGIFSIVNINNGGVATLSTQTNPLSDVYIGRVQDGVVDPTGTLNIVSGGFLDTHTGLGIGVSTTGTVNLGEGGTIQIYDGSNDPIGVTIGREGGGNGTLTQTGGLFDNSFGEDTRIGSFGATGVYNLEGGSAVLTNMRVGFAGTASSGTLNQTGGSLSTIGDFAVAWAEATGVYNMSGGTLNTNGARMRVGATGGPTNGTFNVSGTAVATVGGRIDIATEDGGTGTLNVEGGTLNVTEEIFVAAGFGGGGSVGTFNMNGGTVTASQVRLAFETSAVGTFNINGGTVTTNRVWRNTDPLNLGGTAHVNANGGTLIANGDQGLFIDGITEGVNLMTNGLTINHATFTLGINSGFKGVGGLTVGGDAAGKIYLNGTQNTYTGNTIIQAGGFELLTDGLGIKGLLTFLIGDEGMNNYIAGDNDETIGTVFLDGIIAFNLTSASTTPGVVWDIIHGDTLGGGGASYGTNFEVQGFTKTGETEWSNGQYIFNQISGDLSVIPEPGTCLLLVGGLGVVAAASRRRRS